jgi:vacuolar-type H+-ATPase subunit I/STV1
MIFASLILLLNAALIDGQQKILSFFSKISEENRVLDSDQSKIEKKLEKVDGYLDKFETLVDNCVDFTKNHRQFLKGAFGGLVLAYGSFFPRSVLVIQALSSAGFPELMNNLHELRTTYKKTRKALKEELPEIIDAKEAIETILKKKKTLDAELDDLSKQYKERKINLIVFRSKSKKVKEFIKEILQEKIKLETGVSSFYKVYHAVNPTHLRVTFFLSSF